MKKYIYVIISVVLFAGGLALGYFLFRNDGEIKIVEVEKPVTVWRTDPTTMDYSGLLECAKSPIDIHIGIIGPDEFRVVANDLCKTATATYRIKNVPGINRHQVGLGGGIMKMGDKFKFYVSPKYSRSLSDHLSMGGELFISGFSVVGVGMFAVFTL